MIVLRTYRDRLFAYTTVLVLFLVGSQLYSFSKAREAVLQEAETSLNRTAQLFEANLAAERREFEQFATIVSDDIRVQEYIFVIVNFDSGQDVLRSIYDKQFGWLPADRVVITGNDGNVLLGENNEAMSDSVRAMGLSDASTSFYTQLEDGIELVVTAPINYKGKKLGWIVLTRALDSGWLQQKKKEGAGQLIIEKDGQVLQSTLSNYIGTGFHPEDNRITVNKETYRLFPVSLRGVSSDTARLWFGASITRMTASLLNHRNNALIRVAVGFFIMLLFASLASRYFERPLAQLASFTREISEGRYPVVQKSEANTELDILANQFADMVHALQEKDAQVQKVHRELQDSAVTDTLTGLFNRRAFEAALNRIVENARHGHKNHALCYLDLDQFKIVNDTCRHEAGDDLLRQLTSILKVRVRGNDVLARLGGDEFGLIMSDIDMEQALKVAQELLDIVREFKFFWDEKVFEVGASIGLVMITRDTTSFADVLRHADIACYAAKNEGGNRVHFYQPSDKEVTLLNETVNWIHTLRNALDQNRFQLWFQPIVPTGGKSDIEHGEILLRLIDPDGQIISPGTFIPAAERYNFMPQIDRWVLSNTMRYIKSKLLITDKFLFSINLSALSLNDPDMLAYIQELLRRDNIPGSVICFEITETAAIHNLATATNFVTSLKKLGCRFALDDFGAGLTTFRYLRQLPVDYLKIDGGFVVNMTKNPIDAGMVEAINRISHLMGKETIAEFVENEETNDRLAAMGVDYVQGYWLGKPSPLVQRNTDSRKEKTRPRQAAPEIIPT